MLIKLHCNHSKYCFTSLFPLPVFEPLISGTVVYSSFYSQHVVQWHIVASCSVAWLCPTLCDPMGCSMPGLPVLHYLPELAQTHLYWVGCHPTILSSISPFSSYPQSFPASGSFPVSWLFASGGQRTGASVSASVLPRNIQDCFPLGLTDLISLQSKGVQDKSSTIQKHQFFSAQPSLWPNSHMHIWPLEKS